MESVLQEVNHWPAVLQAICRRDTEGLARLQQSDFVTRLAIDDVAGEPPSFLNALAVSILVAWQWKYDEPSMRQIEFVLRNASVTCNKVIIIRLPDMKRFKGSPLALCAMLNAPSRLLELLVKHGADPNFLYAVDSSTGLRVTPLFQALTCGHFDFFHHMAVCEEKKLSFSEPVAATRALTINAHRLPTARATS
jgi:hypothetical protein